jgi:hypothetical protein
MWPETQLIVKPQFDIFDNVLESMLPLLYTCKYVLCWLGHIEVKGSQTGQVAITRYLKTYTRPNNFERYFGNSVTLFDLYTDLVNLL